MIKITIDKIYDKIREKTGLSDEDINKKIEDKLSQLSGLISREGAAHIIANELNVKLFEQNGKLKIKDILPGMRSVTAILKVLRLYPITEFERNGQKNKVGSALVGDETGTLRLTLWGSQADHLAQMQEGTILKVQDAYVKENRGRTELHLGDRSKLLLNPEGESISHVKQFATDSVRKSIKDLEPDMENVEILGFIVQVDDPRFFEVCPQCGKRIRGEEQYKCPEHGTVRPMVSYVMNTTVDDSTDNVRAVFYKRQTERLLGKTEAEIQAYQANLADFPKQILLGKPVKLIGRTKMNLMFNRLEFVTQMVFTEPDIEEEIQHLKKEIEALKKNPPAPRKTEIVETEESEPEEEPPVEEETI